MIAEVPPSTGAPIAGAGPHGPAPVAEAAEALFGLNGAIAVTLTGSRALGDARPDSDWDLAIYYRSSADAIDPAEVRSLGYSGYVSEPGEWGPVMNGGAWLTVGGLAIDVIYRDLDLVEAWMGEAEAGCFEVLPQSGSLAGAPTYSPMGELASCRTIHGEISRPVFPERLSSTAPALWDRRCALALAFAEIHATRADAVPCSGMLAVAVLCAGHARMAERSEWVLSEKRLVERAGLEGAAEAMPVAVGTGRGLGSCVADVSERLGARPFALR